MLDHEAFMSRIASAADLRSELEAREQELAQTLSLLGMLFERCVFLEKRKEELIEANNRNIELRRTYRRLIKEAFDAGVSTSIAWQRTPVTKRTAPLNEVAEQKFADFAELKIPSPHTHNQGSN